MDGSLPPLNSFTTKAIQMVVSMATFNDSHDNMRDLRGNAFSHSAGGMCMCVAGVASTEGLISYSVVCHTTFEFVSACVCTCCLDLICFPVVTEPLLEAHTVTYSHSQPLIAVCRQRSLLVFVVWAAK